MEAETTTRKIHQARQAWMATLARASVAELEKGLADLAFEPEYRLLRPPESGLIMVRARTGGTGQRFNLGEMTITRCTLALNDGPAGTAYVAGRDNRKAELAALFDALLQDESLNPDLRTGLIEPFIRSQARAKDQQAARSAATKVDFFTLVRGDG